MTELAPLPAVTADERTTLVEFLEYYRTVFLRKVDGLDEAGGRVRIEPGALDLLGLTRHLALVEQWWFSQAFLGKEEPDVWSSPDDPDIDFHHTADDTLADAVAVLVEQIERARAATAGAASLDELTAIEVGPIGDPVRRGRRSLRWVLVHMIEEYARHCGHADLLREAVDGRTGD